MRQVQDVHKLRKVAVARLNESQQKSQQKKDQQVAVRKTESAKGSFQWFWRFAAVAAPLLAVYSLHDVVADYVVRYIAEDTDNHGLKLAFVNDVHSPTTLNDIFLRHKNLLQEEWNNKTQGAAEHCTMLMHQLFDRMDRDQQRLGEHATVPPMSESDPFISEGCMQKMKPQVMDLQSFAKGFADHLSRAEWDAWTITWTVVHLCLKCFRSTWQQKLQTIAFFILWHHEMWISLPWVQEVPGTEFLATLLEAAEKALTKVLAIAALILCAPELFALAVAAQASAAAFSVSATTAQASLTILPAALNVVRQYIQNNTGKVITMVTDTCSIFLWKHVRESCTPFLIDMLVRRGWSEAGGGLNATFFWLRAMFVHALPVFVKEQGPVLWDLVSLLVDCAVQYFCLFNAENALFNLRVLANQDAGVL